MRRRCMLLAAGVVLAAAPLAGRTARAQESGDRERDGKRGEQDRREGDDRDRDRHGDDRDHDKDDRDHDKGDRDKGDRDKGDRDKGDRDKGDRRDDDDRDRGDRDGDGRDRGHGDDRDRAGGPGGPKDASRWKARWDRAGWVLLGEQLVRGKRDRDVIRVGRREGRFTRLMVVVEDSDLEMHSMDVLFARGERFSPQLKHFFREDQRTRAIDLPGERRTIERVEFRYGNLPGGGQARVQVWAREAGPGGGGAPPPPVIEHSPPRRGAPLVVDFWPREGPAGTQVSIQGRRFGPDLAIEFGGQVVRPSRSDESLLTFAVPRHRGRALIVLRRPGRRDLPVGTFEVSGRDGGRERDRWRDERRVAAERWWSERQRKLARSEAEREAALHAEEERLARERERRRRERRAALRARWEQQLLVREDVRAELAIHAERSARLDRMLRLAESGDHGGLAVRVRLLVDFEDDRHQQRMNDLKAAYARR